jgi:hypothetical protein
MYNDFVFDTAFQVFEIIYLTSQSTQLQNLLANFHLNYKHLNI